MKTADTKGDVTFTLDICAAHDEPNPHVHARQDKVLNPQLKRIVKGITSAITKIILGMCQRQRQHHSQHHTQASAQGSLT